MHGCIADALRQDSSCEVRTATLEQPEHGLTAAVLDHTDVLTWWGHMAHDQVQDVIVDRIQTRVLQGMGLIVLLRTLCKAFQAPAGHDVQPDVA